MFADGGGRSWVVEIAVALIPHIPREFPELLDESG
jgi:hypothetical protein